MDVQISNLSIGFYRTCIAASKIKQQKIKAAKNAIIVELMTLYEYSSKILNKSSIISEKVWDSSLTSSV